MVSVGQVAKSIANGTGYVVNKAWEGTKATVKTAYNHPRETVITLASMCTFAQVYKNRESLKKLSNETIKFIESIPFKQHGKTAGAVITSGIIGTQLTFPGKKVEALEEEPTTFQKIKHTAAKSVYPAKVLAIGSAIVYSAENIDMNFVQSYLPKNVSADIAGKSAAGVLALGALYKIIVGSKTPIEKIALVTDPTIKVANGQPMRVPVNKETTFTQWISKTLINMHAKSDIRQIFMKGDKLISPENLAKKLLEEPKRFLAAIFLLNDGNVNPTDLEDGYGSSLITDAAKLTALNILMYGNTEQEVNKFIKDNKDLEKLCKLNIKTTPIGGNNIKSIPTNGKFFILGKNGNWYGYSSDNKKVTFYDITQGKTYTYKRTNKADDQKHFAFNSHIEKIMGGIKEIREFEPPKEKDDVRFTQDDFLKALQRQRLRDLYTQQQFDNINDPVIIQED